MHEYTGYLPPHRKVLFQSLNVALQNLTHTLTRLGLPPPIARITNTRPITNPKCQRIEKQTAPQEKKSCSLELNAYTHGLKILVGMYNKQNHRKALLKSFQLNGIKNNISLFATGSKVRNTLYSIINSTTGQHCSIALIEMVTL